MKTLLHICCAPCSIMCIDTLREEGINVTGFWYNPNIHPLKEFRNRKNTFEKYARSINLKTVINHDYGLREFIDKVYPDYNERCPKCYLMRLEETAKYASENGFDSFSTTLLISPFQNHDMLINICKALEKKYNIEFLYRDFRKYFDEGQNRAREKEMYMQKYCGCIFSEEERYTKRNKKIRLNIK